MRAILFSTFIYLLGIAGVLALRPALMFHADGRWKEFGLKDPETTSLPFWAFCLVWALFSFGLSRLLFTEEADITLAAAPAAALTANAATLSVAANPLSARLTSSLSDEIENAVEPLPIQKRSSKSRRSVLAAVPPPEEEMAKPGYYKLDTSATKRNGVPRYIYLGAEPPAASDTEED